MKVSSVFEMTDNKVELVIKHKRKLWNEKENSRDYRDRVKKSECSDQSSSKMESKDKEDHYTKRRKIDRSNSNTSDEDASKMKPKDEDHYTKLRKINKSNSNTSDSDEDAYRKHARNKYKIYNKSRSDSKSKDKSRKLKNGSKKGKRSKTSKHHKCNSARSSSGERCMEGLKILEPTNSRDTANREATFVRFFHQAISSNIDVLLTGLSYNILKPIIQRANPGQLFKLESDNPNLIKDTDELWKLHCQKEFSTKKREDMETSRDMYMRCLDERETKPYAAKIHLAQDKSLLIMDKDKNNREIISKKKLDSTEPKTGIPRQSKTSKVTFERSKPKRKSGTQSADSPLDYDELDKTDTSSAGNVSSEEIVDSSCDRPSELHSWTIKRFEKHTFEVARTRITEDQQSTRTQGATNGMHGSASNKIAISKAQTSSFMECKIDQKKVDDEYNQCRNYETTVITYVKVKEINGDLFCMPKSYSLAHCVAEDLAMDLGIAAQFSAMFKRIDVLYMQRETQGGLAILEEKERFIYYLITKKKSSGKPTMHTLWCSLKRMQKHIQEHKITRLAIPRLGCGLDHLEWTKVKPMLEFLFQNIDITIIVCNLQKPFQRASVKAQNKCKMVDVYYPITKVSYHTIIVYLGSEDGLITDDIRSINTQFNILQDYKSNLRTKGSVVRTCRYGYILYGFIVRKSSKDVIDFTSLVACVKAFINNNDIDKHRFLAIEAFDDKEDDLLLFKVCNVLRCVLSHAVHILYVCWPNELKCKRLLSKNYYD